MNELLILATPVITLVGVILANNYNKKKEISSRDERIIELEAQHREQKLINENLCKQLSEMQSELQEIRKTLQNLERGCICN